MDGTITKPFLDFGLIRAELGLPAGDLLRQIASLPAGRRKAAFAVIERHEHIALLNLELQEYAAELLRKCRRNGVKTGVVTRNLKRSVEFLCSRFGIEFDAAVTREFPFVKPHPAPVTHMLKQWGISPGDALTVGDYLYDIECGRAAGTATCFFHNAGKSFWGHDADYTVASMRELERIIFPARRAASQ